MRTIALLGLISVAVFGCQVGDPIAARTVSLKFPTAGAPKGAHLAASGPEVTGALELIDQVFASHGLRREPDPPRPEDQAQGIIVCYGRYTVTLKDDMLTVHFVEFGQSHSSAIVQSICRDLRQRLSGRYGVQNVKVDHETEKITVM